MKAPKCPKCGKEHFSTQRCSAEEVKRSGPKGSKPSTSVAPAASGSPANPVQSSAPSVSSLGSAKSLTAEPAPVAPPVGTSTSDGQITNEVHRESSSGDQPVSGEDEPSLRDTLAKECSDEIERGRKVMVGEVIEKLVLTPAEKQKAYRKRLKDDPEAYEDYLEANKLRMRKKRDG